MHLFERGVGRLGGAKILVTGASSPRQARTPVSLLSVTAERQLSGSTSISKDAANESPLTLSRRAGAFAKQAAETTKALRSQVAAASSSSINNINGNGNSSSSKEPWIHPLSELILNRVRSTHSDLETTLTVNADGTVAVEAGLGSNTRLETEYVAESKCHMLALFVDGQKVGEVVVQDYSKSAWQVQLQEDVLFEQVDKFCEVLRQRLGSVNKADV